MKFSIIITLFLALCLLVTCGPTTTNMEGEKEDRPLITYAMRNVNIISAPSNDISAGQTVLISEGKVFSIGNSQEMKIPEGLEIIDGTGKYLIPGLTEMHAHIPVAEEGDDEYVREVLFLYLSNGVTTIRGMLGDPYHLSLKQQVANGEILSPRIFTSGPSFNGNTCTSVEVARKMVTEQAQLGYDFLKIHPGIQLDAFNSLVATANELGIGFAGHVPVDVGIRRALQVKYLSVDHVDGYLEGLVPVDAGVQPDENGFFGLNFTDLADVTSIPELVTMTVENGVWVVPTQSLFERWGGLDDPQMLAKQEEMSYIPPVTLQNWIDRKADFMNQEIFSERTINRFLTIRRKLIFDLYHGGANIAMGSDAPQVFNVPGFSIHHELDSYIRCGLTPSEALELGTSNPARYFGMEQEFGIVSEGAWADLLLVDDNPLTDISNLRDPAGVMVRGIWLSRQDIQTRLAEIEAKYQP